MGTEAKVVAEGKVEEAAETDRVADSLAEVFQVGDSPVEVFPEEEVTNSLNSYFTIHSNNPVA